ncbi:cytochrome oxidase c subunit VIb [Onchocerca flexuosa]|uniref:Cytochrome oxidase c subunit VIb n=1 Tax=Onchocerca flexuosa TaxID=387005 RepID=A0A238C1R7_9BILA|nr:cytochrome oxidase c subunit VIb [Onchocerca flexuosa]
MSDESVAVPETLGTRLEHLKKKYREYKTRQPDAPEWFSREYNEKQRGTEDGILWAAPNDVRYPQCKATRHCFDYYVDYHRCIALLDIKHESCNFFRNVYMDLCPSEWVKLWDEQIKQGIFPGKFNR